MKLIFFFLMLISAQQTIGQLSYTYATKKTEKASFVCAVKLSLKTQRTESCIVSSTQGSKQQKDSLQTLLHKGITELSSTGEVILFFSEKDWQLITTVPDCNASTITMYYQKTIIWGSVEEKRQGKILVKSMPDKHWLKKQ